MQDELIHLLVVSIFIIAVFYSSFKLYKNAIYNNLQSGDTLVKEMEVALTYATSLPGNISYFSNSHDIYASSEIRLYFTISNPKISVGFCVYSSLWEAFKGFLKVTVLDVVSLFVPYGLDIVLVPTFYMLESTGHETAANVVAGTTFLSAMYGIRKFGVHAVEKSASMFVLKRVSRDILFKRIFSKAAKFLSIIGPYALPITAVTLVAINAYMYFDSFVERALNWEKSCNNDIQLDYAEGPDRIIPSLGFPVEMLTKDKCEELYNYISNNQQFSYNSIPSGSWTSFVVCLGYEEINKEDKVFFSDSINNIVEGCIQDGDLRTCLVPNDMWMDYGIPIYTKYPAVTLYLRHFPKYNDKDKYYSNLGTYKVKYKLTKIDNPKGADILVLNFKAFTDAYSES